MCSKRIPVTLIGIASQNRALHYPDPPKTYATASGIPNRGGRAPTAFAAVVNNSRIDM